MSAPADAPRVALRARAARLLADDNRLDLCLVLTLLLLLLYPPERWYVRVPLSVLAVCGFVFPWLRASASLWGVAAALTTLGTYASWYAADNHKYLLAYWCLAVWLALATHAPDRTLALASKRMLGLVFLMAVLHKSLAGDYLSGAFFHYQLLFDQRFAWLARHVGGVPQHMLELDDAARRALVSFDSALTSVRLDSTPRAAVLALWITWWDYLIQVLICLAYALRRPSWLARTRDFWLLSFLASTYLFAPVIGFGWVLAILGLAQTEPGRRRTRALFVAVFLLLQLYRIPWTQLSLPGSGAE